MQHRNSNQPLGAVRAGNSSVDMCGYGDMLPLSVKGHEFMGKKKRLGVVRTTKARIVKKVKSQARTRSPGLAIQYHERECSFQPLEDAGDSAALFSRTQPVLSADEIAKAQGVPTSTAYRYVKELVESRLAGAMERWLRASDRALWSWTSKLGNAICQLLRRPVPCMNCPHRPVSMSCLKIRPVNPAGPRGLETGPGRTLNFGRGRPLPLFRGSSSKAIITLPLHD